MNIEDLKIKMEIVKLSTEMKTKRYDYTTTILKSLSPEQRNNYELTKFPKFPSTDEIMKLSRVIEKFVYEDDQYIINESSEK